jgi:CubicO group peptidase (beta-lactamase class C family)
MKHEEARSTIEERVRETVEDRSDIHNVHLLVHSGSRDIHWNMAFGQTNDHPADPDQPYHAASVGKTFTATLVGMLAENGQLSFDDPITEYLPGELLDGLHVYKGMEYTDDIQIRHLMAHTSGLPHFHSEEYGIFSRKPEQSADGKTFFDVMLADPSRHWDPEETTEWVKQHLSPHFPPEGGVYYSEVGYNLLGLIIEEVTSDSYEDALHEYIFDPLDMTHSYLSQFSEPTVESDHPVANFSIGDETYDVEKYRSFSAWYAGGQTVNTTEDLLKFHRALVDGELVTDETLAQMKQWQKLYMGLDYGYGTVRLRPLPFLKKYYSWGGLGATSSFMFYAPRIDVYLVGSFNQWKYMTNAMRFLFRTLRTVSKVERLE